MYFGTTVYLERSDDENGCLEVLAGGHKIPEPDREAMAVRHYGSLENIPSLDNAMWVDYQETIAAGGRAQGLAVKKVYAEAGDSLIWHPQLPHGGTAITDIQRTRFSFVMHTTPVGVPVYHQNVFFHPSGAFSEMAPWTYRDVDGRKIADIAREVGFGHQRSYPIEQFKRA
jgi:ectoine hydroxylase-related dioxygenase (phytanoyl-CoA dioxygenase family)